jgi:hypothetical protein
MLLDATRRWRPELHLVARAESDHLLRELHDAGVYEVVQPQMEAALQMLRQSLDHLGASEAEVEGLCREQRTQWQSVSHWDRPAWGHLEVTRSSADELVVIIRNR